MYTILLKKGKQQSDITGFDYAFKKFELFYTIVENLNVKLNGRYKIKVDDDNIEQVLKFIDRESEFSNLSVFIYLPETSLEYVQKARPSANFQGVVKMIDIFKTLVKEYGLLFAKGVMYTLYNSIPHEIVDMEEAVKTLQKEYGTGVEITEQMVSKHFIINKVIYPRTVLLSYLSMNRWRQSKLCKSVEMLGNDLVLGAMVKNVKQFMEDKVTYYKTGRTTPLVRSIDTQNLQQMYRILVTERYGINDVFLLMNMYERGLSFYDLVFE